MEATVDQGVKEEVSPRTTRGQKVSCPPVC
jgi:hypothetical protein